MTDRPTKRQLRDQIERLQQFHADNGDDDHGPMGPLTERQEEHIEALLRDVNNRNPEGMAAVNEQLRQERENNEVPPIGERKRNRDYIGSELTTGELMLFDVLGADDNRRPGETLHDPPDDDIYRVAQGQTEDRDRDRDRKSTDGND